MAHHQNFLPLNKQKLNPQTRYRDTLFIKLKRLFVSIIEQLIWMIPAFLICLYIERHLNEWIQLYFNVAQAQKTAIILSQKADLLSEPVILNPSTIASYLKAEFLSMSASTKAFSVSSIAEISLALGNGLLYLSKILICVLGVVKVRKSYHQKTHRNLISYQIFREMMPEFDKIESELKQIREELQHLKSK